MAKSIKVFKTIKDLKGVGGIPATVKGKATLIENPIDSKNFNLVVEFDFLKGDGYEEMKNVNFHGLENISVLHREVIEGENKNWELDYEKVMGRA